MKITALETIRLEEFGNLIFVRVHTDQGLIGVGETFMGPKAVEAYLHETVAPKLLGRDPMQIEAINATLADYYLGWRSAGVETRGNSAVDISLWDIFAKAHGRPLCRHARRALAGSDTDLQHVRRLQVHPRCPGQSVSNWHLGESGGPYEDLEAFLHRADELAHSLLEQGITGMKIWPFDIAAERSGGWDISPDELNLRSNRSARSARPSATRWTSWSSFIRCGACRWRKKLAARLAEFDTYWHEDPFRLDNIGDLKEYARHSKAWVCASETLSFTHAFREYLETQAAGVVMLDLSWCGGLSEARKIAAMAEAWHTPVAPHDCTGPVVYAASCHFSLHARNALIQESVRAFYTGWYRELAEGIPTMSGGEVTVDFNRPGHGIELAPDLVKRPDAVARTSKL